MLVTSSSEPCAVCASEMPSLAFFTPWLSALICEVIEVEIARPAASSAAELMRLPVDRRVIAWLVMAEATFGRLSPARRSRSY
jgi:hypothetical protein